MMPQGFRTACLNCESDRPRPARSGPKAPSPLTPWHRRHSAAPFQNVLPAWTSPDTCANAVPAANGTVTRMSSASRFMAILLLQLVHHLADHAGIGVPKVL